ncbi:hypothetical protein [Paraburkholderia bryophila]|uniref:hypothetical protein n=1 Tax=Paraburkholderia bryophila TaxID=420952 RepID=UPI0015937432|nr:hypothetical protein [Paraburkholderia bryophila]
MTTDLLFGSLSARSGRSTVKAESTTIWHPYSANIRGDLVNIRRRLKAICGVAITGFLVSACSTTPSRQSEESDLSGMYKVVGQSRGQVTQSQFVEAKFYHGDPNLAGGLSAGYLKISGSSTPGAWVFPECGYPGDHTRGVYAGNTDSENIEIIRCRNPKDVRSMPEVFFIKTKDGSSFRYSRGPLDFLSAAVDVPAGSRLLVFWRIPNFHVAYVLKAVDERSGAE